MKKILTMLIACVVIVTCSPSISAAYTQSGFPVAINGEATGYSSFIYNYTHYVPMRKIFEKMGASVFYRKRDNQILALSRDGEMIRHIIGSNVFNVNGQQKVFGTSSISHNNATYISMDMVAAIFAPEEISYINNQLIVRKNILSDDNHKVIKDVLDVCKDSNFHPERFQKYINFHSKMPAYSMPEVILRVNIGLEQPFYENVTTIAQPYELSVLVNKYNQLPAGFTQRNLVNMAKKYTASDGKQYLLEKTAYEKYVQMADAAKKDGVSLRVVSAYRTEDFQRKLYNKKLKSTGKSNADNYSARPGFSEHQTGLAVDINSTRTSFENTSAFKWLQKNAYKYGYILRYQKGKEWITGYAYEPWHYRYVGIDAARIIYQEGITYEEYYSKYVTANEFR